MKRYKLTSIFINSNYKNILKRYTKIKGAKMAITNVHGDKKLYSRYNS